MLIESIELTQFGLFLNQSLSLVELAWIRVAYGCLEADSLLPFLQPSFLFLRRSSGPSAGLQGLTGSPDPPGPPRCGAIWCSEKYCKVKSLLFLQSPVFWGTKEEIEDSSKMQNTKILTFLLTKQKQSWGWFKCYS